MEAITDASYMHAKRVCKDFEIKNLGEYYSFILKVIHYFWRCFRKLEKNVFKDLSFRSCKKLKIIN